MKLTSEQIDFAKECFIKYLRITNRENSLLMDIDHSALLYRLLEDKEIYTNPPPLYLSYPGIAYWIMVKKTLLM